jgi:hypothetical protein
MGLQRRHLHPRGLSMRVKDRVYVKRKYDKKSWKEIASEVKNQEDEHPYWKVVRSAFRELSSDRNQNKKDKYSNCGRKKVLTATLTKWLIKKVKELRLAADCTSTDLQFQAPERSPNIGQRAAVEN